MYNLSISGIVITLLLFAIIHPISSQAGTEQEQLLENSLREWVYFLASDEMKGRANGSPETKIAAEYIADFFQGAGLQPGFSNNYIKEYSFQAWQGGTIDERNVAAIIPGTDPALKDEYIIITAHFDHVGIGRPVDGDSIYNGADDNASGTATIMGIAGSIMEQRLKPGRTLLFVAFSGEEMGLRGSRDFVTDPPVDLRKAYLNLNIEMPGYNRNIGKKRFYMTGASQTNIDDLIGMYNNNSGWTMDNSYEMAERLFGSSDNASFTRIEKQGELFAGVPSTTLCTHTGEDHIHKPHDEPQFIDYENMAGFVRYLTGLVIDLSFTATPAEWTTDKIIRY